MIHYISFTIQNQEALDDIKTRLERWEQEIRDTLYPKVEVEVLDDFLQWDDYYNQWRGDITVQTSREMNITNFLRHHARILDTFYCEAGD